MDSFVLCKLTTDIKSHFKISSALFVVVLYCPCHSRQRFSTGVILTMQGR